MECSAQATFHGAPQPWCDWGCGPVLAASELASKYALARRSRFKSAPLSSIPSISRENERKKTSRYEPRPLSAGSWPFGLEVSRKV